MLMMDTYCYVGCWCGRWWWLISSSYSGSTQKRLCSQASSIPHCLYTAKGYGGQIDWNILRLLGVGYWFPAELTRIRSIPHDWVEYPQQLQMFCRSDSEKMRTSDDHHIGGKQYSNNLAVNNFGDGIHNIVDWISLWAQFTTTFLHPRNALV